MDTIQFIPSGKKIYARFDRKQNVSVEYLNGSSELMLMKNSELSGW
jgi:hypothetical protein